MQADSNWISLLPSRIRDKLRERPELQGVLGNTGWLFLDKAVRMGGGLLVSVWVARYLGPDLFGAFNFAAAFVGLFGAFASLGLDGIVVRDIVREPQRRYEILSSAFALKLGGGVCAFFLSVAAILLTRPGEPQTHLLVGVMAAGMIFQSFDAIDLWFQSQVQSKYTVIARNVAFLLLALARVVLIVSRAPITAFAWASLAEVAIGAVLLIVLYARRLPLSSLLRPGFSTAAVLLRESWPLILSGLAIMVYMRIDQVMLAELIDNREVGLYSVALRFSEIWYFIPGVIVSSFMPFLVQAKAESQEAFGRALQQLFKWLVRGAYLIALPVTFVSTPLITLFYGSDYSRSGVILAIHIWTAVFVFLGVGATPWVVNEGAIKFSLLQTGCGALINLLLNLVLIPLYGGMGAAVATLIAQMFATFLVNACVPGLRPLFRVQWKALLNPW